MGGRMTVESAAQTITKRMAAQNVLGWPEALAVFCAKPLNFMTLYLLHLFFIRPIHWSKKSWHFTAVRINYYSG